MLESPLLVRFWGVRGSLPSPSPSTVVYGGNTPCVEMRCGKRALVFDAGTGIVPLGRALTALGPQRLDLLFSHSHYDHIEGLPFFCPLHEAGFEVHAWSGHLNGRQTTAEMICGYMREPYFPVGPSCFSATVSYHDLVPGDRLDLGDGIMVDTIALNHPGGSVGYRVNYGGHAAAYLTDVEHNPGRIDDKLVSFAHGADVLIYDAMYDDEDIASYRGFGHSTWQHGARLADAAGVGEFVGFHHMPERSDTELAERELKLKHLRPDSRLAREGLSLVPRQPRG
jgi:phosphoribosyl 1,2-cyclic phosphodiesterase